MSGGVRAVLVDLGGVVVALDWEAAFSHWAACAGCASARIRERFRFDAAYERHERGEIDASAYYASLRDALGVDLDEAALAEGWGRIFPRAIAPTVTMLRAAAERIPLYLFSNTNAAHQAVWAARFPEALAPFRRVFTSWEMGVRKPEPAAFARVAREIGEDPRAILFLDDTEENVHGARAAGLRAVHVRSPDDVARALAPWLREAGA